MIKKSIMATCVLMLSACGAGTLSSVPLVANASLGIDDVGTNSNGPATTPDDANFGRLLNNLRVKNGVGTVAHDSRLDAAAQAHAQDMASNNYFSHVSQDGRTALDRIRAAGYEPRAYGENIAGRQQSDQEALNAWINSPSHNEILNVGRFEDFGLGVAGVGSLTRWVLVMGQE